jgi:hypothetical protein
MKLAPIAERYGSDKCRFHTYGPTYDSLFESRQLDVRRVLEIGIGYRGLMTAGYRAGASLYMWAEYFPNAEIWGLDIRPDALVNEGRIHSIQCDQGSMRSLCEAAHQLPGGFDLIVDDGSHEPEHQVLTALALSELRVRNGKYVIEDVRDPKLVVPFLPFRNKVIDLDLVRAFDDRLIVSDL